MWMGSSIKSEILKRKNIYIRKKKKQYKEMSTAQRLGQAGSYILITMDVGLFSPRLDFISFWHTSVFISLASCALKVWLKFYLQILVPIDSKMSSKYII